MRTNGVPIKKMDSLPKRGGKPNAPGAGKMWSWGAELNYYNREENLAKPRDRLNVLFSECDKN